MESRTLLKICFALLLTRKDPSDAILTGNDRVVTKPDPKFEDLPWFTNFGPGSTHDDYSFAKSARYSGASSSSNSLCPSGVTGQFPYSPDCKRFINCWKGRGMIQVCAPGTLFNPVTGECDYPDKVKCVQGNGFASNPQPLISRFPDHRPSIADNPRISRNENYRRPSTPSRLAKQQQQQQVRCPVGGAGLYPHPTDCTQFLNCWGGRMFIQKCGPGTVFDPKMSICEHGDPVTCSTVVAEERPQEKNPEAEVFDRVSPPPESLYDLIDVRTLSEDDIQERVDVKKNDTEIQGGKKGRDPSWGKILNSGSQVFYDASGNPVGRNDWVPSGKPQQGPHHGPIPKPQFQRPNSIPSEPDTKPLVPPSSRFPAEDTLQPSQQIPPQHSLVPPPPPGDTLQPPPAGQNPPFHTFDTKSRFPVEDTLQPSQQIPPQHSPDTKFPPLVHPPKDTLQPPLPGQIPPQFATNERPPPGGSHPYYMRPHNHVMNQYPPHLQNQWGVKYPQYHNPQSYPKPSRPPAYNPHYPSAPSGAAIPGHYILVEDIVPSQTKLILHQNQPEPPRLSLPVANQTVEEPSRYLLPPRPDERPQLGRYPDFGNWKPFYETTVRPTTTTSTTTEAPKQETIPWWGPTAQSPEKSTVSEKWPVYHGSKDIYRPAVTTESTTTEMSTPSTTTNRVYVVYPVKTGGNYEETSPRFPEVATDDSVAPKVDTTKRIKSEIDFDDSKEVFGVKDVEMFNPNLQDLFPNAGKNIRLKPLSTHLDGYLEMKNLDGSWGLVCDKSNGWMINEATVVCKELGYSRGAQISWQGYPLDSSTESIPVTVSEVTCNGDEESIEDCGVVFGANNCDITKDAVGLRCFDNVTTQCHPEEVEYKDNCYRLVKRDDLDDTGFTLEEAADYCKKIGGRITDIVSEEENNFISEWLMEKYPDVRSALTGGIGSEVMGGPLWMWFGSEVPMVYQKWWKGWADERTVRQGSVHKPLCVVLRKSFPCFVVDEEETQLEVELGNIEPEYCPTNYFLWDVEDCSKLAKLNLPHICKKPLEEIGCVVGRGEDYSGTASVTSSGLPCLPWDNPEVKEKLSHQITLKEWSAKLSGHNFCRNLGRQELHPWCFVEGKENSEYCAIPQCWDSVPGYSRSATVKSSCAQTQFECRPGECIRRNWFCDGKKDCSNGRDEAMCSIFLQEFTPARNTRMKGHGREKWPDSTDNICAKLCLESKKFKCKSFSFHNAKKTCVLSDTNKGLSGQLIKEAGWTYYELSVASLNCSLEKGLMPCKNGKCMNVSNICDGKDNCGDGSDEVDCHRLDYQIRLAGSNETNKGRVEVKILGKWGAICDDKFDLRDGEVVCRELGFKHGVAEILPNSQYPMDKPFFLVDDLDCFGNESSIRECSFPGWGRHDCTPQETVGVACRVPHAECSDNQWHCKSSKECIPILYLCDEVADCDDGSDEDKRMCNKPVRVRLAGGPNATAGRLEIQYLGTWGTICDDNFNVEAAGVICRIMGYHGPAQVFKRAHFGPGKGPIWLDGINCYGNESNVDQCVHSTWGKHNCKHEEDVSISCSRLTHRQKSPEVKPIAHSQPETTEQPPLVKVTKVLMQQCGDDANMTIHSIPIEYRAQRERVVGSDVVPGGIPWQASVRVHSPGGKSAHWCGAVVISPYHILTAGHCLRDYSKPAYFIRVGDFDTEVPDPEERDFGIDHLYVHPEFNQKLHLNNDIALVKIKGEMKLGGRVGLACLAPSPDIYEPGTNCSISGWGSISPQSTGFARTLRRAYVPILEPSLCRAPFVYGDSLSPGMFCAGKLEGGIDSCQGDSGGPMMCQYKGKEYLYGITSWGHGCGRANKPGVYTNVAYFSEWIQEKMEMSMG